MTQYLPVDIQSLLPRQGPDVAEVPSIGSQAPPLAGTSYSSSSKGTILAFVRHCGCPFAEKEIQLLGQVAQKEPDVQIVVVQHSDQQDMEQWWKTVKGDTLLPKAKLINDPERQIYAQFGIGSMGWSGLFSLSMVKTLLDLKNNEGIINTPTGKNSWRWQNSGGLVIDPQGIVRWIKIAKDASDYCDYPQAVLSLSHEK
ncbi:unnamed protein product [Sympodiomycopsis kandeliae]